MYHTISTILDYLEESDKIVFKKDGSFVWTFKRSRKSKKAPKGSNATSKR
jgi:hypothetical protein